MKINRLDAHDRLQHFGQQADMISRGCQDCIDNRPAAFEQHPFYIFAHKRQLGLDERFALFTGSHFPNIAEVPTHRLIWQPRLKKPEAQENSMLFKYYPKEDIIKVLWMLPDRVMWDQYTKGNLTEHKIVSESINAFKKNKQGLERDEEDDLPEHVINGIYRKIAEEKMKREI